MKTPCAEDAPLKVLAVDDDSLTRTVLGKMLERMGYIVVLASDGQEAVERYRAEMPDLVLMDITMPEMDGYTATARIREVDPERWVPIILVTALNGDDDYVKGFEAGADEYITKPINKVILRARIASVMRIAAMHRQIVEDACQLAAYREANERELELAKRLISKLTRYGSPNSGPDLVSLYVLPATHFSSDVFASACTPSGELHVMLVDSTGHGLSAALSVVPVVEMFHGMSSKGFSIESIAGELNRKVRQLMPEDSVVKATLASLDLDEKILTLWNAGNPPALLLDAAGHLVQRWESSQPALGKSANAGLSVEPVTFRWDEPMRLCLYSDGLITACNSQGQEWGQLRMENVLASAAPESAFQAVVAAVADHRGDTPLRDDITLACVVCPITLAPAPLPREGDPTACGIHEDSTFGPWKMELRLSAAELRKIDVVPMFLGWVEQLGLPPLHRGKVFLVFTELFNNALDHGVLRLDAAIKQEPDGMNRYFAERRRRLAELTQGVIDIEVARVYCLDTELLKIRIKDSGTGFEPTASTLPDATRPSGRGLMLVRSLCRQVEFADHGSEVTALYALI